MFIRANATVNKEYLNAGSVFIYSSVLRTGGSYQRTIHNPRPPVKRTRAKLKNIAKLYPKLPRILKLGGERLKNRYL